jgi:hypothetical protein
MLFANNKPRVCRDETGRIRRIAPSRRLNRVLPGALAILYLTGGLANATSAIGQLNASITIDSRCTVVLQDATELGSGSDLEGAVAIHCQDGTPTRLVTGPGNPPGPCGIDPACSGTSMVEIEF